MSQSNVEWAEGLTPILARQKAEEAEFESYCLWRDAGMTSERLLPRMAGRYASEYERRYRDEKLLEEPEPNVICWPDEESSNVNAERARVRDFVGGGSEFDAELRGTL